jgi:hypothetical protein
MVFGEERRAFEVFDDSADARYHRRQLTTNAAAFGDGKRALRPLFDGLDGLEEWSNVARVSSRASLYPLMALPSEALPLIRRLLSCGLDRFEPDDAGSISMVEGRRSTADK